MAKTSQKLSSRIRRKKHIRKSIFGTTERPRMTVFRSTKHIYVQIIDDTEGITIASASTMTKDMKTGVKYGGNKAAAAVVGKTIAKIAIDKGISQIVFDRNGYLYHGRVKSLADAAREAGLQF
jgi:large subunit ribosomal protein L18